MNLAELIYESGKGSMAAQKTLYDELSPYYLAMCIRYVKNESDAEERMQDGFYQFFKGIGSFHYISDEGVYSCLHKIMLNECLMQLRKKRVFNIIAEPAETDASLDEDMLNRLEANEIQHFILQLPPGARTVFNLYALEGLKHHEIAASLRIGIGTSKSQFAKAKKFLQKMLSLSKSTYGKHDSK